MRQGLDLLSTGAAQTEISPLVGEYWAEQKTLRYFGVTRDDPTVAFNACDSIESLEGACTQWMRNKIDTYCTTRPLYSAIEPTTRDSLAGLCAASIRNDTSTFEYILQILSSSNEELLQGTTEANIDVHRYSHPEAMKQDMIAFFLAQGLHHVMQHCPSTMNETQWGFLRAMFEHFLSETTSPPSSAS